MSCVLRSPWLAILITVPLLAIGPANAQVNSQPLPIKTQLAFPDLTWTGWQPENEAGETNDLRPIVLTHAGDSTNRIFVADQRGAIHVIPDDDAVKQTKVFLDLQAKVQYHPKMNEEGLLGLAFHPKFKENGQFFVYYTAKTEPKESVISRFRVSKDNPDQADPTEEIIMKIPQPFWNHNGGTIEFGPDGFLYIALGDGGKGNDPLENGQNLGTWLGSILRIDIDRKDPGMNYAIPTDNPFVTKEKAKPEIWAYGLRNVWRMSFDPKTGVLWAGDVGQDLWEEINIIVKGGNYGWNRREGMHRFEKSANPVDANPDMVEPIWEYSHAVGKSITGGNVWRNDRLPELTGAYIYGDYVSGKIWALRYNFDQKKVEANHPIQDRALPIMSFGQDEKGEVYLLTFSNAGKGIYRFVEDGEPAANSANGK